MEQVAVSISPFMICLKTERTIALSSDEVQCIFHALLPSDIAYHANHGIETFVQESRAVHSALAARKVCSSIKFIY